MEQQKRNVLYILGILLMVILQNAVGIRGTPYFLQKKKMLDGMNITLYPQPKHSKVNKSYYIHNLTRSHNYNVTINEPDVCREHNQVFLLILYRIFYAHVRWREIIRELLTHESPMPYRKGLIVKHLFIFGNSGNQHIERLIRNESKRYRDIIQEDFKESYFNLTKKVITAWKWAVNYCPNAEYVMILNDEVLIDLDKMIHFLLQDYSSGQYDDHFALCYSRINKRPLFLKLPRYKAMPRRSLYKGDFFPSYCHGWGYAAHIKVINKLYKASFTNPAFMPTDAWIGILSEKLRLQIPDHRERFVVYNCSKYFADPLYPTRLGMIAVTDFGNKYHELKVMKSIIKSLRRHKKMMNYSAIQLSAEFSRDSNNYFKVYVVITIFSFLVIGILLKIYTRLRNQYYC